MVTLGAASLSHKSLAFQGIAYEPPVWALIIAALRSVIGALVLQVVYDGVVIDVYAWSASRCASSCTRLRTGCASTPKPNHNTHYFVYYSSSEMGTGIRH